MASKFIEEIRRHMRMRGDSLKTEKAYIYWIKYFIRFNKLKHPCSGQLQPDTFFRDFS